ncbi:hypothetical protein L6452_34283 [Arctium lappa]|uniref:Uncharacterized protein n=1 Tax=Arctium lappa TaxID=4217 RepID=A0ACB8YIG7_ARCLA|nr:hypothetical protein L6452_34283 [Arctium lappa]
METNRSSSELGKRREHITSLYRTKIDSDRDRQQPPLDNRMDLEETIDEENDELFDQITNQGYYSERKAADLARTIVDLIETCYRKMRCHGFKSLSSGERLATTIIVCYRLCTSDYGITWPKQLNAPIEVVDPEIADIIELEKVRQWKICIKQSLVFTLDSKFHSLTGFSVLLIKGLELIPSENFTSLSVMQAVGSVMTNKYSEGYPGAGYYAGNGYINMAETLCQKRALEAFRLDLAKWGESKVDFYGRRVCDLSSVNNVKSFSSRFKAKEVPIHVMVNTHAALLKIKKLNFNNMKREMVKIYMPRVVTEAGMFHALKIEPLDGFLKLNIPFLICHGTKNLYIMLDRNLITSQNDTSRGGITVNREKVMITGLLDGSGEYTLVYKDNEGYRMLVGDVPWQYCLWILGDEKVHLKERSIWGSLILDAKARRLNSKIFGCDGEAIGLPFELTEQEKDVVSFDKSSFVLGRSGTGKTTVLTMKLFQNEQLHHLACEGFHDAVDQRNEEVKQDALHQLFVTFSPKLCYAVREQFDQWKRLTCGGSLSAECSSVSIDDIDKTMLFEDIPDHFIHLPHDAYPLIITFHKFLLMLDGTVGTSYFERFPCIRKHGTSRLVFLEHKMRSMDVTYEKFCSRYWPHFNEKLTKNLYPSMVYTEIMSVIKGGLTTGDQAPSGILSRDDYVALCDGRTSILDAQKRQIIYAIFLQYEKKKTEKGDFDLADLVNDLHQRLEVDGYNGDPIDYVYIDEVQDLSMRQIALFKYVCTNVHEGFAFCGDTAQAIAKGIGFRFEDIRCLFFRMFLSGPEKGQISKIFQLSDNFRTHVGVLSLAQSVIDLLFHFFPLFVDHLSPETSRIHGDLPILLETDINNDALKTIFGRNGDDCQQFTGFGAEQVVLVRDEHLKEKVVDIVGKKSLVLTIMESKGLEFQDVLLYDFFSTSSFSNEWRIIYEYMKEKGPPNLPSTALSSSFNMEKHNVLCSELKQLYVAITRTRQRLWICETMGFSQPIYDYWKKLSLVEVRRLNDSFADEMQIRSSEDDWKLRGVKLFCEKNYIMAEMCFLKAGDKNSARLAEAYHLRALADGHQASQLERKKLFKDAAKLFREIGKIEPAAECFYEMEDFKSMMECVGSFCSKHEMRNFLMKKRCLAELILLEIKWGNFEEAVNVARLKPDHVVEAYLHRMGGFCIEYSSLIILWHVLSNSPIFQGVEEPIAQKNGLLKKAVSIAESDSDVFDQLRAIAKSPPASKSERKKLFKDAARLFRGIGKNELAVHCCYKIKDYRTAGDIYQSEYMLKKAAKCFYLAKCYDLAAEAYANAGAFAECLDACADGKLFEMGFQFIDRWGGCGDNELKFFDKGARYYYGVKDFKNMMKFVRSFHCKDEMRSFLIKKMCLAELILLEIEWGNFERAINAARLKPDPVVEADLLLIGGLHRESSLIILWHVLSNSPLFQDADKLIAQKNELLAKASSIAKSDYAVFDQLRAIADSPPASKLESKKLFKDAAKLFREIGKNELAAQCFYKIEDYRTAGDIYQSESMLEKAGNCFCLAKCYELAVEAYDKAGACAKCLLACSDGNLFEIGFQLIGRWGGCGDAELEFYHNAAHYYFDVKDSNSMIKCVRSFRSKDDMRVFLAKKHCLDELISLEREWGNFVEAAKVASLKPDPVLQADLLRMGGLYRESSLIILWHVFSNSILFRSIEEPFTQKDELLTKAVSIAKSDSDVFYQFVCKEAEILSKGETQEDLLKNGLEFLYLYKNNTLSVSLERVKTTHEIEKIEKEVLDLLRSLFKSGNRLDELLLLEEVRGDFVGAAKIGIEDDHSLEAALRRLWYVFFGSLWLKDFNQKDNLLDDAKSYVEYHPDSEDSALVHTEISVLSSLEINLSQMWRYLRKPPRERSLRIQFLTSRRILDVHLHSRSEVYACIQICDENGTINYLGGELSQDSVSVEGLIYIWNHWKGLMLDLINLGQVGKGSKIYAEFIFNYFGVRKYDRDTNGFYVVLDAEAQWVKQMKPPVMRKNGYLYITPARKFSSVASRYWCSELVFVAEKVLNKLNTLCTYSTVKNFSIHQQMKILTGLFEVARSLQKCKLPYDWIRASRIVHRSFQPCVDKFLSNVFDIDWKNSQSKEMISLRGNETFLNMLEEAVNINSKSWKDLTCGQLGTIAMIILGSRIGVNDDIKRKVRACSSMNWRDLFDKLNGNGTKSGNLAIGLHNVLKEAFCGGWRVDGCMSTTCFLYLMERLLILSFGFNGYVFTTRSSCVEWLANGHEDWSMGSNGALDTMKNIHHSLASMVSEMLNSEDDLMEWLTRSKDSSSSSYAILVLRLTLLLSLICANSGQHYYHLLDLLQRCHFVSFLPSGFHEALVKGLKEDHLVDALVVACKEIDNPLVVMSFTNDFSESLCQNAIFLEMTKPVLSTEMVIEVLYP